ncbi:hypothetical protein D9758_006115 [Tetrapyrgos nigripes]|uniref:Uncharacterized protein n=1 Tax=Tetrapyrgos nigripes TaxID=182062 RepID=A0A8H5G045_9AGAR|nr:hypothetical protein D9758_006115 [Tetrapyrgos nigripes]
MTSLLEMTLERTTEAGSRQLVYAALGGTEEEMGGGYVNHTKVDEPSDFAISAKGAEFQNRIHAELLELLPLVGSSKESVKDYLKI